MASCYTVAALTFLYQKTMNNIIAINSLINLILVLVSGIIISCWGAKG